MTKKAYMAPVATIEMAEPAQMLANSALDQNMGDQDISIGGTFGGEFSTKGFNSTSANWESW